MVDGGGGIWRADRCGWQAPLVYLPLPPFLGSPPPTQVDNTKLFYVWVFGASGAVCNLLWQRWSTVGAGSAVKRLGGRVLLAAVFLSLILSGALCLVGETMSSSQLYVRCNGCCLVAWCLLERGQGVQGAACGARFPHPPTHL